MRIKKVLLGVGGIILSLAVFFLLSLHLLEVRGFYGAGGEILIPIVSLSYLLGYILEELYEDKEE